MRIRKWQTQGIILAAVFLLAFGGGWSGCGRGVYAYAAVSHTASPSQFLPSASPAAPEADTGLSLQVDDYRLSPTGNPREQLDVLKKNESAKLTVTISGSVFSEETLKKSDLSVGRIRDGYRTDGTPTIKMISKKGDPLEFQVTFPRITYMGGDTDFHFHVRRRGAGNRAVSLTVKIDETESAPAKVPGSGKSGGRNGESLQPLIRVERAGDFPSIEPGKTAVFTIRVINDSRHTDAEDITATITPAPPLYLAQDTNVKFLGKLKAGQSQEISVTLQAGKDLSGISQMLDVELRYQYEADDQFLQGNLSQKMVIPVGEGPLDGQPFIRISQIGDRMPVGPGQDFQAILRVENTSRTKAGNVILTLEPNDQILLMDASDTWLVGDLEPGQWSDVGVQLKASQELSALPSQMLGASVKFDYDAGKGVTQGSFSEKIVIPTEGGRQGAASLTPNLIVKNYSYGGSAQAGQVFELVMEISNTSKNIAAENILMSLNTGEGLSINDATNTFYIPSLGPGASERRTVNIQALFQSKLQSPKVEITFKYEYLDHKDRKQNTTSETIAIPVYQPDRLEVRQPSYPDGVREQEECAISIPYVNKGRGQLFNLEASLEGEMPVLERQISAGNLEPGKTGTIDFIVIPDRTGEFKGQVTILYEDEAMNQKKITVPIEFKAEAAAAEESVFPEIQESGRKGPGILLLSAGLILLSGICCAGIWKIKKKGKGQPDEDREDLWEKWDEEEEPDEKG